MDVKRQAREKIAKANPLRWHGAIGSVDLSNCKASMEEQGRKYSER
jgi:hypothetical protein